MIPRKWYLAVHAFRVRRAALVAHAEHMQRLFSMFPRGSPGVALLLLRTSVAAAVLTEHYAYRGGLSTASWVAAALIFLALAVGYLTPIAATAGVLLHVAVLFRFDAGATAYTLILCLDAIALALLGPGAYSLDGYRFGRRIVVLPAE